MISLLSQQAVHPVSALSGHERYAAIEVLLFALQMLFDGGQQQPIQITECFADQRMVSAG
jgi:hypothetical protein